jgi:pyruvate ferredoxin oxidoreductase delta subunit
MNHEKWNELTPGCVNPRPGNSVNNFTGSYRKGEKPNFDESFCINCFFCWVFCPDNAIMTEDEKVIGINYDYCKGCGICVNECPVKHGPKPLKMIKELFEL